MLKRVFPGIRSWMLMSAIGVVLVLVYGQFLRSPIVFDDVNHFGRLAHPEYQDLVRFFAFTPRWISYATFEWTRLLLGNDIAWYRLGNLILHVAVAWTLFAFLRRLFEAVMPQEPALQPPGVRPLSPLWLAFFGALLFALHPAAVYGVAYLIQRTILMATLFTLAMWYCFLQGVLQQKRALLLASVAAYLLAVLSKQHAVMAPAVPLVLLVLLGKIGELRRLWPVFILYALIACYIVFGTQSSVLAHLYEPRAPGMLEMLMARDPQFNAALAWPLSIMTQAWLFFKYLWVWMFPGPAWMAVDMYEPFATRLLSWPQTAGLLAFLAYPLFAIWLLLQRGSRGLAGFALLCPWLLFATEFSTIRLSEPFVLYRSYLWMPGIFAFLPLLCRRAPAKRAAVVLTLLALVLLPVTWGRLTTFSSGLLLWQDAARLIQDKHQWPGTERVYHNRGLQFTLLGQHEAAIEDYNRALALNPRHLLAYNDRGATYLQQGDYARAIADFSKAIEINSNYPRSWFGRALAYEGLQREEAALNDYRVSCELGFVEGCGRLLAGR